jgi:cytidylate kinase
MSDNFIITIDGPAGSGKSTSAKLVAGKLGFLYLDTGAMYRAVAYLAIKNGILNDETKILESLKAASIQMEYSDGKVFVRLNDEDVSDIIRTHEVSSYVSEVSAIAGVRYWLLEKQREIGHGTNLVCDGRDTGTAVFPDADVKIYLVASIRARAERRLLEFRQKDPSITIEQVAENLEKRDKIDSEREVNPLKKAPDAVEIDTSGLTIEVQVNRILEIVEAKRKMKG